MNAVTKITSLFLNRNWIGFLMLSIAFFSYRPAHAQSEISMTTLEKPGTLLRMRIQGAPSAAITVEGLEENYSPDRQEYTTASDKIVIKGDVSQLTAATCQLTEINVNCPTLESLDLTYNRLTSLDLSRAAGLKNLSCTGNNIGALDLSGNKALETLSCSNNGLTRLTVASDALRYVSCHLNKLPGEMMTALCEALPDLSGEIAADADLPGQIVLRNDDKVEQEGNEVADVLISRLLQKGWQPYSVVFWEPTPINLVDRGVFLSFHTQTPIGEMIGLEIQPVEGESFEIEGVEGKPVEGWSEYTVTDPEIKIYGKVEFVMITGEDEANISDIDLSKATSLEDLEIVGGSHTFSQLTVADLPNLQRILVTEIPSLTAVKVSGCPVLEDLCVQRNALSGIEVSNCPALNFVAVFENGLKGEAMNSFVDALPMRKATDEYRNLYLVNTQVGSEGNEYDDALLQKIIDKNWCPYDWYLAEGEDDDENKGRLLDPSAISSTTMPSASLELIVRDGALLIVGTQPGEYITVWNLQGVAIFSVQASAAGVATIPQGKLAAGLYLISTAQGQSLKMSVPTAM